MGNIAWLDLSVFVTLSQVLLVVFGGWTLLTMGRAIRVARAEEKDLRLSQHILATMNPEERQRVLEHLKGIDS